MWKSIRKEKYSKYILGKERSRRKKTRFEFTYSYWKGQFIWSID